MATDTTVQQRPDIAENNDHAQKPFNGSDYLLAKHLRAETTQPSNIADRFGTATDASLKPKDAPNWGDKVPGAGTLPPSPYVFSALSNALEKDLKMNPNWRAINGPQRELLGQSLSLGPEVDALTQLGLLDGAAQKGGVNKVNDMFARHGIPIKLDDVGPDGIAAGGVFHFKAQWEGTETKLNAKDANGVQTEFPAFEKSVKSFNINGQTVLEVYRDDKKGISMYMTPTDSEFKGYAAYDKAFELTPGANSQADRYSKAIIPKMKVRDEGDVPQLLGMQAAGGYGIKQAKIFTSADIDQSGAEVKQGLGVVMTRSLQPVHQVFKMDKPPLVWIMQDGASKPLIAFRVGQESWKDRKK